MIVFLESHIECLKFLHKQPPQIFADFCKLAWNLLQKGPNLKLYQAAAQKLEVDVKQIQSGVEGLCFLFIEAKRFELNEDGFREAVKNLGLPDETFSIIYSEYSNQRNILDEAIPQNGIALPQYKNLEWRFEAQVSSKALKKQIKPRVIMKLDLEKPGKTESICFQSDIPNIIHMNQLLNQALQESRTQHSKRILRAVA